MDQTVEISGRRALFTYCGVPLSLTCSGDKGWRLQSGRDGVFDDMGAGQILARDLKEEPPIVREEIGRAISEGKSAPVWQYFAVVPDMRATGVENGKRRYDWPVILRAVNTVDAMTATVPEFEWSLLETITNRILAEVPGVCRVLYDLTPKPIGTIEFE